MKRFLSFLLAAIVCLGAVSLAACKKQNDAPDSVAVYYTVAFNANGGSEVTSQRVEEGKTASAPIPPTKANCEFVGWYYYGNEWDFNRSVTSDITLTAKWYDKSVRYRVTTGVQKSLGNRGSAEIVGKQASSAAFAEGEVVTLRAVAAEGFAFIGWEDLTTGEIISRDEEYSFTVLSDVTLRADFD